MAKDSLPSREIKNIRDVKYIHGLYRNILSVDKITDIDYLIILINLNV